MCLPHLSLSGRERLMFIYSIICLSKRADEDAFRPVPTDFGTVLKQFHEWTPEPPTTTMLQHYVGGRRDINMG